MNHLVAKAYNQMKKPQIENVKNQHKLKKHVPIPTAEEIACWTEELVDEIVFILTDNLKTLRHYISLYPEQINPDLEIVHKDKHILVSNHIQYNSSKFYNSLNQTISNLVKKENMFKYGKIPTNKKTKTMLEMFNKLYQHYVELCNNKVQKNNSLNNINESIKMLIEIEVKGLIKTKINNNNI